MSPSGPGRYFSLWSGPFSKKEDMSLKDHLKEFAKECLLFQSAEAINWVYGVLTWLCFGLLFHALANLVNQ
jgi:hypothetical protein